MNEASERYNVKVEIPISAILETIFSDDNQDVETLCRWAKKYGFVDLIKKNQNDKLGCYTLQDDYTKQSFYILLDKDERKQYDYENYLCEENDKLQKENKQLKEKYLNAVADYELEKSKNCQAIKYIENNIYSSVATMKTILHLECDEVYDLLERLKGGEEND